MGVQVLLVFTGNRLGILPSFNAQDNHCNKESSTPDAIVPELRNPEVDPRTKACSPMRVRWKMKGSADL